MSDKQALGPNQTAWLAALRSGEREQGMEYLCREDSEGSLCYCCLGVACELIGIKKSRYMKSSHYNFDGEASWAPPQVVRSLALRTAQGNSISGKREDALASLNDNGKTFAEIADIIEADPSKYFTEPR